MSKLSEIVEGFGNMAKIRFGGKVPQDVQDEADRRASICADCKHNTGTNCGICGCFLSGKVLSMKSFCPDTPRRWDVFKSETGI